MDRGERAKHYFLQGYNCSQSVALAFADVMGMEEKNIARLASAFGGGMSRMREVCGAVSGMALVLGYLQGYDTAGDDAGKKALYTAMQHLAGRFRQQQGSIVCREILGKCDASPNPTPRTASFYQTRPCAGAIALAADILQAYLEEEGLC